MPIAKDVKPASLSFVLGGQSPLAREDALLCCVAAIVADGSFKNAKEMILFTLRDKVAPSLVREAILTTGPLAGLPRVDTGLAALERAAEEVETPDDPLAAFLGAPQKKGTSVGKAADPEDEEPAGDGSALALAVLGKAAGDFEHRLSRRSRTLEGWVRDQLFGGVFARSGGLTVERRLLLSVAALAPLDARPTLETFVRAAHAKGVKPPVLWALFELVSRLFREGPEVKSALQAFEAVLGRRAQDDALGPGADPFRWD